MTDKIGPLGESLKPAAKSEDSDAKGANGNDSAKRGRKKPAGRLGNNKSTGSSKKPRKATAKKASTKKRTTAKKSAAKKPASKAATKKVAGKKADPKKRQPTPTKKPPAAESKSTGAKKSVIESDPDKTSIVDVKKELGKSRPSLLDRLLDTSSPSSEKKESSDDETSGSEPSTPKTDVAKKTTTETNPPETSTDKVKSDLPLDTDKPDDLFSNLNRAPQTKDKSSSDDFEDLLLGGLSGSETSKVVQPKSKAQHWTKQDHERPTEIPSSKAASTKKTVNRVNTKIEEESKKVSKVDDDATDEIRGDSKTPIGRQTSRPKPPPPPAAEPKPLVDESNDSPESTTIHDTPTSEVTVETTKPEADIASEAKPSAAPNVSAGVSAVRKRAREKAEAAKKRLAETTAVDEETQSTAEMLKENATSTVQDKDEQTEISNDSGISSRKTEEIVEKQEPEDGFESSQVSDEPEITADVTGEVDRRGRGFKVSTESVKQSLRPPPRVRARKVRRVVRHVDPWSVLTFSVLFHLTIFSSLLLGSVLIWQVAAASGTIENIEDVVKDLGSFETYELNGWAIFRAAVAIAAIFTLASTILVVIMSVIFNLISDLVGGIRVTVVQEETVRVQRDK